MRLNSLHLQGLWVLATHVWHCHGMFSSRALPNRASMDPSVRLRANLEDLWLSGHESAERAQTLFQDAAHWDPHCEDYARAGASGRLPGNINRDLRSKLLKNKHWCTPYYAWIRVWDPKKKCLIRTLCPMMLPHELVACLLNYNDPERLCCSEGLANTVRQHLDEVKAALGSPLVVPLSLWGDGVPCNWDRSESIEVLTTALPGLSSIIRLPLLGMSKPLMPKTHTWNEAFAVLS